MDKIYAFNKLTKLGTCIGEIQTEFNISFVIDGTKDSSKMVIHSWNGNEIEPYTILFHKNTNSWWVVANDKVERYYNESGFYYIHSLTLLGLIELLNARDLTDCGFNDNTYTINQFITRLFNLSTFEYPLVFGSGVDINFLNKNVNFIKTFENYTLLSALWEFLDAFNMSPKMTMGYSYNQQNDTYTISVAQLHIIPKTGNYSNYHSIDDFDDVKETKTINKNSYGTCVVSNAENVISSKAKTFPSTGAVNVSADEYNITPDNAIIRLPSKVYKANWLKIITQRAPLRLNIHYLGKDVLEQEPIECNAYSGVSIENAWDRIRDLIIQYTTQTIYNSFANAFESHKDDVIEKLKKASAVTLYNGNVFNPITGDIQKGSNVPYLVYANFHSKEPLSLAVRPFVFCDKDMRNNLIRKWQGIQWERGSNIISGFDCFQGVTGSQNSIYIRLANTDLQQSTNQYVYFTYSYDSDTTITLATQYNPSGAQVVYHFGPGNGGDVSFIVNYYPMSDIKIKVDNTRDKKDIQLYNQNGKVTDNVALSKLINSYSKQISSDTITRYMQYYSFSDIPNVGDIVISGNEYYVINNISLDFMQNENETYYISAEITMSKYVSTKTLMVNPNSNIRDYGIPQNYNVKRKQLYRDYYELAYQTFSDANVEAPYYDYTKIFNFTHSTNYFINFIAVIKITYDHAVGGDSNGVGASNTWYYQLEPTVYNLDKMVYVLLDFNDNNIIGYGSQNVFSGFDVSRIFTGLTDALNTPISYVDEYGKLLGIDVLFCTIEQINAFYEEYQEDNGGGNWDGLLYNYSVFIPEEIYESAFDEHEIQISEPNYNKDALEVPVFEYACQINDSDDVFIGDNILTQYDNCIYFYSYAFGTNLTPNNAIPSTNVQAVTSPIGWRIYDSCVFDTIEPSSGVKLFRTQLKYSSRYNAETGSWTYGGNVNVTQDMDLAIFRHALDLTTGQVKAIDLMFIARKVPNHHISGSILSLDINHYKLK